MSYEYEEAMGTLRPPRLSPTRTEILLGGGISAKRTARAEVIREAERVAAAARRAAADDKGGVLPWDEDEPFDEFFDEDGEDGGNGAPGTPWLIWAGLGAVILGTGSFVAYKLAKDKKRRKAPALS